MLHRVHRALPLLAQHHNIFLPKCAYTTVCCSRNGIIYTTLLGWHTYTSLYVCVCTGCQRWCAMPNQSLIFSLHCTDRDTDLFHLSRVPQSNIDIHIFQNHAFPNELYTWSIYLCHTECRDVNQTKLMGHINGKWFPESDYWNMPQVMY